MATPVVSTKNTKQEILEAYEELVRQLKQGNTSDITPTKLVKSQQDFSQLQDQLEQQIAIINQSAVSSLNQVSKTLIDASLQITNKLKDSAQTIQYSLEAQQALQENFLLDQAKLKKQRQQEQEDFDYDFTKQKQRQAQELKEIQVSKEKDWQQREGELKGREEELKSLKSLSETFESRVEQAVKEAVAANTKELTSQHAHELALLTQQQNSQVALLQQQVDSNKLTATLQQKEIERLQKEVAAANTQLTSIAQRAVEKAPVHSVKSTSD